MSRILIIDDDLPILESMKLVLSDEGHLVETISEPRSVLPLSKPFPEIIFLDLWMSGMDGRELGKKIKNNPETAVIPLIIFSANKDIAELASSVGADGYLAKPFSIEDLFAKIEAYVVYPKRK